jgi:hypothetical protein
MVVQRHRFHTETSAELSHGQVFQALFVDKGKGGVDDCIDRERRARSSAFVMLSPQA